MTATDQINEYMAEVDGWRGETLKQVIAIIRKVDPPLGEDWKWGSPVFTSNGNVCSTGVFKEHIGTHFFQGASLEDKHGLFNAGLDAKKMRNIKFMEGDTINEAALLDLINEAVAFNAS